MDNLIVCTMFFIVAKVASTDFELFCWVELHDNFAEPIQCSTDHLLHLYV